MEYRCEGRAPDQNVADNEHFEVCDTSMCVCARCDPKIRLFPIHIRGNVVSYLVRNTLSQICKWHIGIWHAAPRKSQPMAWHSAVEVGFISQLYRGVMGHGRIEFNHAHAS
jgi:hypothetical protein